MSFTINYLTRIEFGDDALFQLDETLQRLNIKRPLLITDKGLSSSSIINKVIDASSYVTPSLIYDATPSNPTEAAVGEALETMRRQECDGLIAFGGGSCIDLSKAVRLLATHPGPLRQYAAIEKGSEKITSNMPDLIAVPTTAGTGSEVGRATLITMHDNRKLGLLSPHLIPTTAICDPELTMDLPRSLTATTGMDAIAHCIETYLSPKINPPAEAIALDGLSRAITNIEAAVNEQNDISVRSEMMMASLEGALAFQKGLGGVHSLSHALGGYHDLNLHHGTLNAVLLPAVLRFNESYCMEKYKRISSIINVKVDETPDQFFYNLNKKLNIPTRLRDMGVPEDILEEAAQWALEDHSTATNPRPLDTDDLYNLLVEAY
ncbi:iron-containing alcohol dehydrogenase [Aidingimonas lacisalsi]|uniref:iron-containing alcohol dehydrogenase n=1 Tax=Aidingimonas lacisalsi TaxID=2604086 RepID=UPI0011D1BE86|nr:iron-containing alcohol dehydrogenase [Aidingimonas lacisalsi]